jgi:hypothetical protein
MNPPNAMQFGQEMAHFGGFFAVFAGSAERAWHRSGFASKIGVLEIGKRCTVASKEFS